MPKDFFKEIFSMCTCLHIIACIGVQCVLLCFLLGIGFSFIIDLK